MNTKRNMKRISVSMLVIVLLLGFLSGCGKKETGGLKTFVERIQPLNEALLPLLDSYTSGVIASGDPIVVKFKNPEMMKVKFGDAISAKAFQFTPALKGKAVWIDENTVGFQYDEINKDQNYVCKFNMSEFLDVAADQNLEFGFSVRRQNFSLVAQQPICTSNESMDYNLRIAFAVPVDQDDAINLFDESFRKNHPVEVSFEGNNVYSFKIQGFERKNANYPVHVVLDGKAVDAKAKMDRELIIYAKDNFIPLSFDVDRSSDHATLFFSQPLKEDQNLMGYVTVPRNLAYKADIKGNRIDFYFDKSKLYSYQLDDLTIGIGSGIRAANGMLLQEEAEYELNLTEVLPKVRWTDDGVIIPNVDETTIYFDAICINAVTLRIVRIYDDNILSFLQDNELNETYGVRKAGRLEKKVRLAVDNPYPNQWKTFPIVLSDYIKVEPGAMYQLSLNFGPADYTFASDEMKTAVVDNEAMEADYWDGESYDYKEYNYEGEWGDPNGYYYYNYVETKKNIVVSDLAVTAKMGRNDVVDVFVYQISDAKPATGSQVTAYNYQKQELVKGNVDGQGHVQLKCANRPAFVVATDKKGSKSVIKLNDGNALSYSRFDIAGEPVEKGVNAFAYSNRGVWRPGDELQLNLMLNDFESIVPDNYPVVLEVIDASGRLYAKQVNTKPVNDIYCFTVPTNVSDETGLWMARYKVGTNVITSNLRVETVKPNRLEINFSLPEVVSITRNDRANLTARWLNGMKANGLKAEVDVTVRKGVTSFKNFADYSFDNISLSFEPEEISLFSGQLNAEGVASVGFGPLQYVSSGQMMNGTFTVKVFEKGGDFSIASFASKLSPYERYVGVRLPETLSKYGSYYDTEKDWKFDIAVVNENGTACKSSVALDYALYKLDSYWWWSSEDIYDLQRYASGTYRSPVQNGILTCNGTTSVTFNIPDEKWGSYLFVVNDEQGGHSFAKVINFDWGYGHSSSASGAPAQLAMKATADSYQVGEKIVVTFPANDKAKALVTVEANDKVLQTMLVENLGQEGKVEITATEEMIPNVYVYVALIQPHDATNDLPIRLYGVIPVKVENKKLQLQPNIQVPETTNTKKKLDVKINEAAGQAMTYTLAIVDEGILGLTNFKTPNPYGYFNSKQALSVRTWDNYTSIVDAFSGELGSVYAIGGDGILNQEVTLDKRFKAYAVTLGPFELKAGETNTHSFDVPQCSGALRFMVVAKGNGKALGSAEKRMTVVDPINLFASAPRVVAPGDELNLKVQVQAPTMKNKTLTVKFDNKNLEPMGSLPTTVQIDGNGEGMVAAWLKIPNTLGNSELKVSVTGDGYTAESSTVMPIRMPNAERRNTITKDIEAGQTVSVPFELVGMPNTQQGNVTVSTLLPVDLFGRIDYLLRYPHGCLEQMTSKAFPQLYLNYFMQLDDKTKAEMKENVEWAVSEMKAYQKSDFSLSNWPTGRYVDPWTEIYALHFLVEAKNQGYNVPQYFLDGLLNYQSNRAKQWKDNIDYKQGETIQAYRLFVLALAGKAEMGAMNRFKELEMRYDLTKVLAAGAFAQTGKTNIAQKLMPVVEDGKAMSDYYSSYGSRTRDFAFYTYVQMLCDVDQQTVQNNINEVCQMISGRRWLDTQSTAFTLFTLGKYAEKMNVTNTHLSTTVKVNGEERTLNTNMASTGFAFTPKLGNNAIEIKNNTDQKMIANIFTKTSVAEYDMNESGNMLKMTVEYYDKCGSPANLNSLAAGTDLVVKIRVQNPSDWRITDLALSYYLPSGWELINERLSGDMTDNEGAKHIDFRDDRAYFYFDLWSGDKVTFTLKANATYEGNYMIPAVRCEDMYNADIYYQIPARGCVVK